MRSLLPNRRGKLAGKVKELAQDVACLTGRVAELEKNRHQEEIDELFKLAKAIKAKCVKIDAKVK